MFISTLLSLYINNTIKKIIHLEKMEKILVMLNAIVINCIL